MKVRDLIDKMDMFQEVVIVAGWASAGMYRYKAGDVPVSFRRCEIKGIGTHDGNSEIVIDVFKA